MKANQLWPPKKDCLGWHAMVATASFPEEEGQGEGAFVSAGPVCAGTPAPHRDQASAHRV